MSDTLIDFILAISWFILLFIVGVLIIKVEDLERRLKRLEEKQ